MPRGRSSKHDERPGRVPRRPCALSAEPVFWFYVKEVLNKHELQRFYSLRHIASDVGRGRAWLRCALNEHSLERYLHMLLADRSRLRYRERVWEGVRRVAKLTASGFRLPGFASRSLHLGQLGSYSPRLFSCAVGTVGQRIHENACKGLSVAPACSKHSVDASY